MMLMESFTFSFSQPNGEPQTPTRTPSFGDSTFQTPKLESSFYDPRVTWDTADPYASSPEFLRTPQRFGLNTPSNPLRLPEDHHDVPHLKSSSTKHPEDTDTAKRIRHTKSHGSFGEDGPRTVDSAKSAASMQTPPPSSASRRKVTGLGDFTRDHDAPGSHLETPSRFMGSSPRMFANLQSSPDLFQLGAVDPAASPFFPQEKLFWEDPIDETGNEAGLSGTSNVDLLGANNSTESLHQHHHNLHYSNHAMQGHHHPVIPQLPTIEGQVDLPGFNVGGFGVAHTTAPTAPTDAAFFPAPFSTSPRLPSTRAEDPAMFLSSPARRFGGPQPTPDRRRVSRQPYHHQTEESKREQLRRVQSVHPTLEPEADDDDEDDFTPRLARPGLSRSLTHTAATSSSSRASLGQPGGMMASTSGIRKSPSKGRLSPMKPIRNPLPRSHSVAAGLPAQASSVVLKVGKDGRAKAEMETVPEVPSSTGLSDPMGTMDLDGSTTESEYDGAEYSDYPPVPPPLSRNPSFAFSDAGRPAFPRSDSGSRPHSKGSYASSVGSGHSGRASPWRPGSARGLVRRPQNPYRPSSSNDWRRTPSKRQPPGVNSDFTYGSASSGSDAFAEPEEESGDAQQALRKVLRERGRNPKPHTIGFGPRSNPSSRSLTHLRSSPPPRFGADMDFHPRLDSSPTTVTDPDIATPITNRYSNPSNGTRCVCQSMDNGGHLMIQW